MADSSPFPSPADYPSAAQNDESRVEEYDDDGFDLSSSPSRIEAEVDLGSARGRRGAAASGLEVVRELGSDDLPLLCNPTAVAAPSQSLRQIRHSHHQLAQLLARGDSSQEEAALITGYSPSYISILKGDPAFRDLVSYYVGQREQRVVDVYERMRTLGLSTLDELQRRLEENPEEYTIRLLLEQLETLVVKPAQVARTFGAAGSAGGSAVSVSVNFVTANHAESSSVIDVTPDRDFDK